MNLAMANSKWTRAHVEKRCGTGGGGGGGGGGDDDDDDDDDDDGDDDDDDDDDDESLHPQPSHPHSPGGAAKLHSFTLP